jgi:hypothetical protein
MEKPKKARRPRADAPQPSAPAGKPGYSKVTMWLPSDVAHRLRVFAAWTQADLGDVAAPALEGAMAGFTVFQRDGRTPPTAKGPAEPAAAAAEPDEGLRIAAG